MNEKTVAIAVQATRLTGRMLARIGELYLRHVREKHRDNKIARSRDAVRDFSEEGEDYYKILSIYYFGETTYRGSIAENMIGFSHTTCLRKRKTAIKLFGALFWKNILIYWDNSVEEMYKIECEEGRDGTLSERRKMEDDRRSGVLDRRKGDRRKMGDRRVASFRHISSLI